MARQQPESKLVGQIKAALEEKYGGLWIKVHGGPYQQGGISDLIGCIEGCFIALEVKVPGRENTLTERQRHFLSNVETNAGLGAMVTSAEEALKIVRGYMNLD